MYADNLLLQHESLQHHQRTMPKNVNEFSPVKLLNAGAGRVSKNLQTGPFFHTGQQLSQKRCDLLLTYVQTTLRELRS